MSNRKKLSISLIVPTYNDECTIIKQLTVCQKILEKYCNEYEIIIADDKSVDQTRELLKKYYKNHKEFRLIFNKHNLGITRNVQQLYTLAKKDYILFYSADGDWNPHDVEHLIQTQMRDDAAIVIGKRTKKIGYTPYRHIISFFHKLLPLLFFNVNTIDPGGIKIVKKDLAQIRLVSKSQFFEAEMIIRAKKKKAKVSWYPIMYKKIIYGGGKGGSLTDAMHSLLDIVRLRIFLYSNN